MLRAPRRVSPDAARQGRLETDGTLKAREGEEGGETEAGAAGSSVREPGPAQRKFCAGGGFASGMGTFIWPVWAAGGGSA